MILSGIVILLYPIIANLIANRERSQAVSSYSESMKKLSDTEKKEQLNLAKEYNEYIFNRQQENEVVNVDYKKILRLNEVMGSVDIPAINIKEMPFYQGTDYQTLNKGLGHFETTSIPIGGKNTRSVITGHSGVQNQILFTDVLRLKEGDIFFINILGERLAYQIYSLEEVLPTEIDKIKIEPGKDIVTLLTCTPPGINTFRLLVNGKRIDYKEAIDKKITKRNHFNYTNVVLTALVVNALIFFALLGIYRYYLKQKKSKNRKKAKNAKKKLKTLLLLTKILFGTLFFFMLLVLLFALYGYFKMQQEPSLQPIDIGVQSELSDYNLSKQESAIFDEKQIASVGINEYAMAKNSTKQTINESGIGKLIIPKVAIDLPILAGIANQNLLTGASTYRKDQQLGKDNYVLLTHNIYDKDLLFQRIEELKTGDVIYATDFDSMYTYEVFLNEVVVETETNYIEKESDKELITLLRCEGDIGTIYRRLVQGKLKNKESLDTFNKAELNELNLVTQASKTEGVLLTKDPISKADKVGINLAAKVVVDPIQTIIPIFLLFLMPILFFSLI